MHSRLYPQQPPPGRCMSCRIIPFSPTRPPGVCLDRARSIASRPVVSQCPLAAASVASKGKQNRTAAAARQGFEREAPPQTTGTGTGTGTAQSHMQPGLLRPDEAATQTQGPRDSAASHCRGCAQRRGDGDERMPVPCSVLWHSYGRPCPAMARCRLHCIVS